MLKYHNHFILEDEFDKKIKRISNKQQQKEYFQSLVMNSLPENLSKRLEH